MADQIYSGESFANGQQVDATRLNNHVAHATLLAGAITEQADIGDPVEQVDKLLIFDNSTNTLKRINVSALTGAIPASNITTLTSSVINGQTNKDITITPNDGVIVTGKSFSSSNGLLVAVSSTAHGLITGQLVSVVASNTSYSGLFQITIVDNDVFTYSFTPAVTPASGTCNYQAKGILRITGNSVVTGNSIVAGSSVVDGSSSIAGNQTISGNLEVAGTATLKNAPQILTSVIKPRFDYFVQTRANATLTSGWGGLQNLANIYGTKISALDITFTPQKAGNKVVLTWNIFGESTYSADTVYLVTRTPNSGTGAGVPVALPDAVDSSNNTWSGVTTAVGQTDSSSPRSFIVKIVDSNTLDVNCTYSVYFRGSNNRTTTFFLNRSVGAVGQVDFETGMSLAHAHEIYT